MEYPYKTTPESFLTYQYSKFLGFDFIDAYKFFRSEALKSFKLDLNKNRLDNLISNFLKSHKIVAFNTHSLLQLLSEKDIKKEDLIMLFLFQNENKVKDKTTNQIIYTLLSRLIKKYEISRSIYSNKYRDLESYVLFAANLVIYYKHSGNIKFLNALLKLNDSLCSVHEKITKDYIVLLYFSINAEIEEVKKLFNKKSLRI